MVEKPWIMPYSVQKTESGLLVATAQEQLPTHGPSPLAKLFGMPVLTNAIYPSWTPMGLLGDMVKKLRGEIETHSQLPDWITNKEDVASSLNEAHETFERSLAETAIGRWAKEVS